MKNDKAVERPPIGSIKSGSEIRKWYSLKSELLAHAKELKLKTSGGKFTILDRIAHYLDTGEKNWAGDNITAPKSKFDWHKEPLNFDTVITDSYKNSQNVRRFFKEHADPNFKFNIEFMNWMKSNAGKTLADAVIEYKTMINRQSQPEFKSKIATHNQFNQYTRDFLDDNPELGLAEVRKFWALKIKLPSETGRHIYERSDLDLK